MKMSKIEKRFVNSKRHAQKNLELIERLFNQIDLSDVNRVLEIGCGVGIVSAHLADKYNMNVIGIDLDPEQITIAKTYNKESEHLKFIEADATKLLFGDHEFDMVLSIYVLHHAGNWEKMLEEVNRVIKPGGCFVLYDLACSKFTARVFGPLVKKYAFYTIDDIGHCLSGYGFKIIHTEKPKGMIMKNYTIVFRKL